MEENAKEILKSVLEFFAIMVPGVLVYAVLSYRVPDLIAKFTPNTFIRRKIHDSPAAEDGKTEEKHGLSIFFILLQAYVAGFIVFAFSGVLDLLPSPASRIMGSQRFAIYNNLRNEFKTNPPVECKIVSTLENFDDEDLFDTARSYIRLRNQDGARDVEIVRTEFRLCRSVSFFFAFLACLALYFRQRFVPRWRPLVVWMVCLALLFFCKFTQRKLEAQKESFRYALILKAMPEASRTHPADSKTK